MDPLSLAMTAVSTAISAYGNMKAGQAAASEGMAAQQAANYKAALAEQQAGQKRATAQRASGEERRRERLVQSSLQARAAAGGGGASDPTVVSLAEDIAGEGEYRALTALYEGEEAARSLETTGALSRYTGEQARRAGDIRRGAFRTKALTSVVSGIGTAAGSEYGQTLYEKYGKEFLGG